MKARIAREIVSWDETISEKKQLTALAELDELEADNKDLYITLERRNTQRGLDLRDMDALEAKCDAQGKEIEELKKHQEALITGIDKVNNVGVELRRENAKLNTLLFHHENGLSHPELKSELALIRKLGVLKDLLSSLGRHDPQCERRAIKDKKDGLNPICDCGLDEALKETSYD